MGNRTPQGFGSKESIYRILRGADGSLRYARIDSEISSAVMKRAVGPDLSARAAVMLNAPTNRTKHVFLQLRKSQHGSGKEAVPVSFPHDMRVTPSGAHGQTGTLSAFGMFWQRNHVHWFGKPKLLGRRKLGSADVNFARQVGIYLLHDRDRIIYVGRAADTLYARLKTHTVDRMAGRWDRFSWFGLRSVGADGAMLTCSSAWSHTVVMEVMEALLIESLEPPLNRKRGDNLSGVEYLQVPDPEIELTRKRQLLEELIKTAGWNG